MRLELFPLKMKIIKYLKCFTLTKIIIFIVSNCNTTINFAIGNALTR